jgi:CarD family transcriptional regulator
MGRRGAARRSQATRPVGATDARNSRDFLRVIERNGKLCYCAAIKLPPIRRPLRSVNGKRGAEEGMPVTPVTLTQASPNFKVGDKAVYPGQGVGEVMGIEHKEVAGQRQSFYVLRILENGMKIMIPMNKVGSVGLREIIGEKDVRKVYSILREKEVSVDSTTWNRRYREYLDKIKSGSVLEIAEVLRDLYLLRSDKDLSFGERKMLDTARSLLIKELAIAKECDEQDVETDLKKIFNC